MVDLDMADSRILVVDDEESLRLTFKMFLTREGYGPVTTASTFEEALVLIEKQIFDLIISDIVMEGSSGIDLLRRVKELNLKCPVVMVTGYPNIDTATEAVRLGAYDYLSKPVKKNDLLRTARMALQQYTLWKENKRLEEEKDHYRQYLETIFRSVRDIIITFDPQMKVVELNDSARIWLKTIAPAFTVGSAIEELPGALGNLFAADVKDVLRNRDEVYEHRIEFQPEGKDLAVFRVSAAPLEARNNNFLGVVLVARDVSRLEALEQRGKRPQFHRLIGISNPMQTVYALVENVGKVDTSVLIIGESGTGKELVADALHAESTRHDMPLIKVDCTAIPENLLESELFGHRKGSFTGADRDRKGRIIQADGGTLFLDEIGDISSMMQLRLLRFLQEKTFYPVGQDRPIQVDVRVIAATNADLKQRVNEGLFREDLYFRLRVVDIILPPLRERKEDIPLLVKYFIGRFSKRLAKEIVGITDQALAMLCDFNWPGNVRELEHVLERACVLCPAASTITTDHLSIEITNHGAPVGHYERGKAIFTAALPTITAAETESEVERIVRTLKIVGGNKAKAARLLAIDRSTLYRKMRFYDIDSAELDQ